MGILRVVMTGYGSQLYVGKITKQLKNRGFKAKIAGG
jgi:hypothetical protein